MDARNRKEKLDGTAERESQDMRKEASAMSGRVYAGWAAVHVYAVSVRHAARQRHDTLLSH
ncbi:hypothetical protein E2C01_028074 [Portunus trituberculatus]|uniref:Uncharacterized protein n=1 Tax=Portunus trituberculatus TaxID=210409 RepID=A0A5B7EN89_PORTR|nr:hypothetical protein [Portunus trituberculatus]